MSGQEGGKGGQGINELQQAGGDLPQLIFAIVASGGMKSWVDYTLESEERH